MTPEMLHPAIRQYRHNNSDDFVFGFDYEETRKIVTGLESKLRNLVEAAEWRDECREAMTHIKYSGVFFWRETETHCKSMLFSAEADYHAALKAAKEE